MPRKKNTITVPKPRRLPSGKSHISIMVDGQRHSVTADNDADCIREAAALKLRLKSAPKLSPVEETLRTLAERWLIEYGEKADPPLSPSTIAGYDRIIRCRAKDIIDLPAGKITPQLWKDSVTAAKKSYAPKTVRNTYTFLRNVWQTYTGMTVLLDLPDPDPKRTYDFLDYEQIEALVSILKGSDIEIPALLALSSLRRSEILALSWECVDLRRGLLYVRAATVADKTGKLIRKDSTKTKASARTVPIIAPLQEALEAVEDKTGLVCPSITTHIGQRFNTLLRRSGLPETACHGLRHSFASLAYHLQMPQAITQEIGGWSDPGTMRKIYTHIAQSDRAHYESAFTAFFDPPEGETPKKDPQKD